MTFVRNHEVGTDGAHLCSLCTEGHYRSGAACMQCPSSRGLAGTLAGFAAAPEASERAPTGRRVMWIGLVALAGLLHLLEPLLEVTAARVLHRHVLVGRRRHERVLDAAAHGELGAAPEGLGQQPAGLMVSRSTVSSFGRSGDGTLASQGTLSG